MREITFPCQFQHANEDVEKMILGNKCDMDDRRIVSKERGEQVSQVNNQCILLSADFDVVSLFHIDAVIHCFFFLTFEESSQATL